MKKNIAIVAGGNSGEYEISIQSASVVEKNLDTGLYNSYIIVIKGSDWYYLDKDCKRFDVDKNDFSIIIQGEKIIFDCVFIAIHGTPGEDGKLQGYFDLLAIPYTSCNQTTSALTFNKSFCNRIVIYHHCGKNCSFRINIVWYLSFNSLCHNFSYLL